MWQTIEYKAAAIEQFRKGDLLQRNIDDVQSEAANAAEMKAAASGNPLILMQVQLASDLRKLEALYSQHQRAQHRLRDRLKWLGGIDERLAKAEEQYATAIEHRDKHTHWVKDKDKEKIQLLLHVGEQVLTEKQSETMKKFFLDCIKDIQRTSGNKPTFGTYRGFRIAAQYARPMGNDGFRLILYGPNGLEYQPANLLYTFDDKFSLSGMFQRVDNFLGKGLDDMIATHRHRTEQEKAELETVKSAMDKPFPQQTELTLCRENHAAVIRELQRMQDDPDYVSEWKPKTELVTEENVQRLRL